MEIHNTIRKSSFEYWQKLDSSSCKTSWSFFPLIFLVSDRASVTTGLCWSLWIDMEYGQREFEVWYVYDDIMFDHQTRTLHDMIRQLNYHLNILCFSRNTPSLYHLWSIYILINWLLFLDITIKQINTNVACHVI